MRVTFRVKPICIGIYAVSFAILAIGCTAAQMGRVQDATKKVEDTAAVVATVPVPPNPFTDWAGIIAAGAGSLLLVEKALGKYIIPTGVNSAKNGGTLPSNSTTVTTPIPTIPIPPTATVTETTTINKPTT